MSPLSALYFLLQAVVLLFLFLSVGVAARQARVHLAWLVPLAVGESVGLVNSIVGLLMPWYMAAHGTSFTERNVWLIPQQFLSTFTTLAFLWFAIALFRTLSTQVFAPPAPPQPPPVPGSWPPPPSPPSI